MLRALLAGVFLCLLIAPSTLGAGPGWDYQVDRQPRVLTVTGTPPAPDEATLRMVMDLDTDRLTFQHTRDHNATLRIDIDWVALVEFRDNDLDGRYSLGDPVVQRVALRETFRDHFVTSFTDPRGIAAVYPLPGMPGAEFRLRFHVPDDGDVTPHIDVHMTVARFAYQTDNNTRLALETRVRGAVLEAPHAAAARDDLWRIAWDWAPHAGSVAENWTIAATLQPYLTTPREALVVFSHPRATDLDHAATLFLSAVPDADGRLLFLPKVGDWRIFLFGVVLSGVAVALTVRHVLRRDG